MTPIDQHMHRIVAEVFYDLQQASADCGEPLCAQGLADYLGDRAHDELPAYRALPYAERSALALRVAQEYL